MIQADPSTNSLIITAPEPLYRNIRAIVDKLDTRRAQVVIESLIVEVTADKAAEFGIQWQALGGIDNSGTNVIGGTNFGVGGQNIINAAQNIGSLGQGLNLGCGARPHQYSRHRRSSESRVSWRERSQTNADANILSTPTIQTLDNEEAKFLVGQNIPLITGSFTHTGGAAPSIRSRPSSGSDIGLQLRVKPQISEGGVVRLAIYQELSSIQNTLTAAQGGIITNKRSFESTRPGRRRQHRRAGRIDRGPHRQQQEPGPGAGRDSGRGRIVPVREPRPPQDEPAGFPAPVCSAG